MFRKQSEANDLKNVALCKSSTIRNLRAKLCEQYQWLNDTPSALDAVLSKKAKLSHAKTCAHQVASQKLLFRSDSNRTTALHYISSLIRISTPDPCVNQLIVVLLHVALTR
jgi:hypothetical protein